MVLTQDRVQWRVLVIEASKPLVLLLQSLLVTNMDFRKIGGDGGRLVELVQDRVQ
jgi:hypothetical protein